ncbi:UDP-galactopyranose mutase [Rubneribacter badeniensis]|uniref:UDP-galactopyranose mutase n=2 Tax=Rubneribacter badeniensis TaxID=2070688 RepID=A0A2K2U318_9ACTN|nr:UDP-galactopyranose mutase [Rubneribacter badeniensis]
MRMRSHYDYLIVGAGITSAVFAHEAKEAGRSCLVIDRRSHVAGNIYTEEVEGINVHKYGAHIFHTSLRPVWEYVNRFAEFNNYVNSPVAVYKDELYNMPFNMNTFSKMWGVRTPTEARAIIEEQKAACAVDEPKNLEEQALSLVGRDVYEKLVKGYTEKQWGRDCTELPASIIKRLPVRFIYDNNYFNDRWQGIPIGGYTAMVERMLGDTEVLLDTEYRDFIAEHPGIADRVIYCGPIDEYFDYRLGALEYRSLRFESERVECDNWQGNAVVNYTEREVPYTRIIEHKHFEFGTQPVSIITREYPATWERGDEPYYPINDERNGALYAEYAKLAEQEGNVVFAGRLGGYKYYDMDKAIDAAFDVVKAELGVDLRA